MSTAERETKALQRPESQRLFNAEMKQKHKEKGGHVKTQTCGLGLDSHQHKPQQSLVLLTFLPGEHVLKGKQLLALQGSPPPLGRTHSLSL